MYVWRTMFSPKNAAAKANGKPRFKTVNCLRRKMIYQAINQQNHPRKQRWKRSVFAATTPQLAISRGGLTDTLEANHQLTFHESSLLPEHQLKKLCPLGVILVGKPVKARTFSILLCKVGWCRRRQHVLTYCIQSIGCRHGGKMEYCISTLTIKFISKSINIPVIPIECLSQVVR